MDADNRYYLITIDVYKDGEVTTVQIDPENEGDEPLYTINTAASPVYSFNGSKLD